MVTLDSASLERALDSCTDIAGFAVVGYLSGRLVNSLKNWSIMPSFFSKAELMDLRSATACCALFIMVDRFVQGIINQMLKGQELDRARRLMDKPFFSAARICMNGFIAIEMFNMLAKSFKMAKIEQKPAATLLLTALFIYTHLQFYLNCYNRRN